MQQEKLILLKKLEAIEGVARGPLLNRFLYHPFRYLSAMIYWHLLYPIKERGRYAKATTFFGSEMQVILPSATEIFLFGAKTHDSEIRLARFLIHQLKAGDFFCDVGAHFGFFSLLAAHLVGDSGQVVAFEASKNTFEIFEKNIRATKQLLAEHKAASNTNESLTFHEYSVLYSEYNSLIEQSIEQGQKAKKVTIPGQRLDDYFFSMGSYPAVIKVDVEGAELRVVQGMEEMIKKQSPIMVMEYLTEPSQNEGHEKTIQFMRACGYGTYIIEPTGTLRRSREVRADLDKRQLDSDNIVFVKNVQGEE